jgi:UDP-N-acetylglucosamine acyltransferase
MAIHPTAIVEEGARIDPSCEIGAYAVIGAQVRLGAGCSVGPHGIVTGRTTMGQGNRVFSGAVVGGIPQDLKYRGEPTATVIGDQNTFREFVTINAGTAQDRGVTTIGNGCLFMANSHVGHDCVIGDGAIIANSVALAGHVVLEDHVHFGGLSAAHQFSRVGRLAFIGGLTGVAMDVAPYCMINGPRGELTGLNVIGLQRSGMNEEQVGRVKQAFKIYFRSSLQAAEALAQLKGELGQHPEVAHLVTFIEGTRRGITR